MDPSFRCDRSGMHCDRIQQVDWSCGGADLVAIRRAVFQVEQGVPQDLEFDGKDADAVHWLAYWNDRPVGTARLRWVNETTVKIERVAVLAACRRRGLAQQLMREAIAFARKQGATEAIVHAQLSVEGLYGKLGFERQGEVFAEADIPHVKMVLARLCQDG